MDEQTDFPKLASPARRALSNAGYTSLIQLQAVSERELLALHGMGPNAIKVLKDALEESGLTFKEE